VINRNTDRLNVWSTETIHMASIETGSLKKERQDVAETIHAIVDSLALDFIDTPVEVHIPEMPCEAEFDRDMIRLVLRLLVDNASKYSPAGSPVVISCGQEAEIAVVSVKDFGPGIPVDEQDRIFEKYYRGQRVRDIPGTGLGLAIARNIVRAHSGDLWVVSEPDRGATFLFSLRCSRKPAP
jgi:signal transduction histidine kinase